MNDKHDPKKQDSGVNPVVAGGVGAVLGGAAALAATALADEKNRQKLAEVKDQVVEKAQQFSTEAKQVMDEVKHEAEAKTKSGK